MYSKFRTLFVVVSVALVAASCGSDPETTANLPVSGEGTASSGTVPSGTVPATVDQPSTIDEPATTTQDSDTPVTDGLGEDPEPEEPGTEPTGIEALAATLVDKPLAEAEGIAEANDATMRVVKQDGEDYAVTKDYIVDRINVAVVDGVVTSIEFIG